MPQRRRESDRGHDHATLVHYLESIDRRCEQGFKGVDERLDTMATSRASCQKEHNERMAKLERARAWLLGAAAVVGLVVSAVSFVLADEISELRKQRPQQPPIVMAP